MCDVYAASERYNHTLVTADILMRQGILWMSNVLIHIYTISALICNASTEFEIGIHIFAYIIVWITKKGVMYSLEHGTSLNASNTYLVSNII